MSGRLSPGEIGRTDPMSEWPFGDLKRGHYAAILADPAWTFEAWYSGGWRKRADGTRYYSSPSPRAARYPTMVAEDIAALPVASLAAPDCVLFLWGCWPTLPQAMHVMDGWGFQYKSCAFLWTKANVQQLEMFRDDADADMLLGYWTRANTEFCLLGTRGKPKRIGADIQQPIIEPRRQHSRKPDCVPSRIERLVAGPYVELFARTRRPGWDAWGNETNKFAAPLTAAEDAADSLASYNAAVMAIGERVKAGEKVPEFMLSRKAPP